MVDEFSTNNEISGQEPSAPHPPANQHPLYHQAQLLMNKGDWNGAHTLLLELLKLYPNHPLFTQLESSARTRIALMGESWQPETVEVEPERGVSRRVKLLLAGLGVSVVLCAIVTGIFTWIFLLPQATGQHQQAQIEQLRKEAETAISSGDYDRAVLAYNQLLELLPDDPQALAGIEQAGQLRATISLYSDAITEMEAHRWENALGLLQKIEDEQPGYRDVASRIKYVQRQQVLEATFAEGEAAFENGNYELAIQKYESLQAEEPGFERDLIRGRLFLAYLQYGQVQLDTAENDPQKLQATLETFEKALSYRPEDSQAKGESQLLRLYLAGLEEYEAESWAAVISNLTPVYETRPNYSNGNARKLLFNAYLARGDELFEEGQFDQARSQYEQALLMTGVEDTSVAVQKIAQVEVAQAPPTVTPTPASTPTPVRGGGGSGNVVFSAPKPTPTPTPAYTPYTLKSMKIRNNCSGFGYIHGVIWNAYQLPVGGVSVRAFNETTGAGPFVSNPSNNDGIYQIVLKSDQIAGLWSVQVLENEQPASLVWGQRLGGECLNGAQELKVDWTREVQTQ